ncbi:acylneuraminate cytidylyltransferase family protein [Marinobacter bryozoorum]|uniref:acylneuraminate cytidylyltransferase family protein n=1 Tax=Marinobacter bryozoorum TaxID=256324 RepID=UPI002005E2F5|nr:acylneuraminate cytidylyltransferase family protein [Marinobacter bryozoorum]MCK7544317.1 acylneuraminate cytidylyltransferase family protein [Marinobacter bryozoorum]
MTDKVTCFLPCRAGSQRVVRKNIKPFASYEHGLIEIKLRQLLAAEGIDEVVLTTNDADILAYAESLDEPRLRLHRRVEELSSSATSTDQLVAHALELIPEGHILWTHVTSPFITAKHYDEVIRIYREQREQGYDSLMTTTAIHGFLWQDEQPMNYDRTIEKWPRTQTLAPVHEVNSGAFLAPADLYRELDDRIGRRPYLYAMDKFTSFDIDWPEDFVIAECILEKGRQL